MLFGTEFTSRFVRTAEATIHCRMGGEGPPLLLLHGCPQSHVMWHKLVPELARSFTVVAADLRGYGDSEKPRGLPNHENYSFRAMAQDQLELMASLGFTTFAAVGHDRGARVLHRMALDHPDSLARIALLDILPASVLYERTDRGFASAYWEWFFFIQEPPFPEELLASNPEAFLRHELGALVEADHITQEAWSEYLRIYSDRNAMHAMCEDYRATWAIDLAHDGVDRGRKIECDVLVLWGDKNPAWKEFDVLDVWREFATRAQGAPINSGHYLAEEAPDEVLQILLPFLGG